MAAFQHPKPYTIENNHLKYLGHKKLEILFTLGRQFPSTAYQKEPNYMWMALYKTVVSPVH